MKRVRGFTVALFAASVVMGLSIDGFAQSSFWVRTAGPYGGSVRAIGFKAGGDVIAGTMHGVYHSQNEGDTWTEMSAGLTHTQIETLVITPQGDMFVGTWGGGVFRSVDEGENWQAVNTGLADEFCSGACPRSSALVLCLVLDRTGALVAGTYGGGIYRSQDDGATWQAVKNGLTNHDVLSLALASDGSLFAGTYGDGIYRSQDDGATWQAVNAGLTDHAVWSLVVAAEGALFAGTDGGVVFHSENNGATWTAVTTSPSGTSVRSLIVNEDGVLFAGASGDGVLRSQDDGSTWRAVNAGLENDVLRSLAVNEEGVLFAGTSHGLFRSENDGGQWREINTGMSNSIVKYGPDKYGRPGSCRRVKWLCLCQHVWRRHLPIDG